MERLNLAGGAPLATRPANVPLMPVKVFATEHKQGMVLDAREPEAFAGGHIPGAYNVWLEGLAVFPGWLANQTTPIFLVLPTMDTVETAVLSLARLGVDNVVGVLAGGFQAWREAGQPIASLDTMSVRELEKTCDRHVIIDVRDDTEFEDEGHIASAHHMYVGYLDKHLERLRDVVKTKQTIAV
ncbi:MAG TPA: rhodanese-like domain-containing protein, partial [Kofleriaceae bacterium]|nr:rhodanese-like domain-containing protein [Kofleriaceae bacterium]